MLPRFLLAALALAAAPAFAQADAPDDWHLRDADADGIPGISLARAYEILGDRQPEAVVVAVLDSGVDTAHPDLQPVLWVNADEVAGNGIDDDGNGYVDDVHGWSFLGGPDGENLQHDTLELARLVALCRAGTPDATYADCDALEAELAEERQGLAAQAPQVAQILAQMRSADGYLRETFGDAYDPEDPSALDVGDDAQARQAQGFLAAVTAQIGPMSLLEDYETQIRERLEYNLNPDYDVRAIVGDDVADLDERLYGNADVTGPDAGHGTGVAGLIGAARGNGLGIDGIAPVQIMAVRTVPGGDERDKDVANAIRYAVDNGAHILNMSFGKSFSPQKAAVDAAVQYAAEKGVLLVHAAGNSGEDIDAEDNFPSAVLLDGTVSPLWLEVGASARDRGELAAAFSNYGATRVDLFAPGAQVTSLKPGGATQVADGTSFASPIVAGVAALLMAYFPELEATDVREILLESAVRYADDEVARPGDGKAVRFGDLSVTGGVVNAAEAVRLAQARTAG